MEMPARDGVVLWQQELSSYAGLAADFNNVYVTSDFDAVVALNRAAGYVRRQLAPRLRTKRVPDLHFALDDLLERGNKIENLLKEDEQ